MVAGPHVAAHTQVNAATRKWLSVHGVFNILDHSDRHLTKATVYRHMAEQIHIAHADLS
jgi:hypothetical protein